MHTKFSKKNKNVSSKRAYEQQSMDIKKKN